MEPFFVDGFDMMLFDESFFNAIDFADDRSGEVKKAKMNEWRAAALLELSSRVHSASYGMWI